MTTHTPHTEEIPMTVRHPRTRRLTFLAVGVCLSLHLSGCSTTPDDPKPTTASTTTTAAPTPEPTPTPVDPVEAAKQQDIAEARATYEAYKAARDAVDKAGTAGWESLLTYLGSAETISETTNYYHQASEQGLVQTGDTVIASMTVVEHVPDPSGSGHQQVRIDVCLDNSAVDVLDPQGESVLMPGYPPRLVNEVLMQRQSDRWTLAQAETNEDRPC